MYFTKNFFQILGSMASSSSSDDSVGIDRLAIGMDSKLASTSDVIRTIETGRSDATSEEGYEMEDEGKT